MGGTILFIFLLDSVPGSILNNTLETIQVPHDNPATIQKCDHTITDPLLQIMSKELDVLMAPKWMMAEDDLQSYHENHPNETSVNVNGFNAISDVNKVVDSVENSVEYQNIGDVEYDVENSKYLNDSSGFNFNVTELPDRVPFLAAIFESLTNVTGQTCAGTVVAPQWVMTAATCVNLLSNLYQNSTNSTERSVYTIIINATDPLVDGTAHNVTDIYLEPLPSPSDALKNLTFLNKLPNIFRNITKELAEEVIKDEETQKLALMKIDPPTDVEGLLILDGVQRVARVVAYGWYMKKNASGHDSMHAVAVEAQVLDTAACEAHYNITADTFELCLAAADHHPDLVNQMSWGGPVTTRGGGALGVTRVDGHSPLSAWPAAPHVSWIRSIINKN